MRIDADRLHASLAEFAHIGATPGEWRERVSAADLAAYDARVATLIGPELAAWVHGGRLASGVDPDR